MMTARSETGCHRYAGQAPETWSVENLLAEDFLIDDDSEHLRDRRVLDIENIVVLGSC
jgi:hypothetical protein